MFLLDILPLVGFPQHKNVCNPGASWQVTPQIPDYNWNHNNCSCYEEENRRFGQHFYFLEWGRRKQAGQMHGHRGTRAWDPWPGKQSSKSENRTTMPSSFPSIACKKVDPISLLVACASTLVRRHLLLAAASSYCSLRSSQSSFSQSNSRQFSSPVASTPRLGFHFQFPRSLWFGVEAAVREEWMMSLLSDAAPVSSPSALAKHHYNQVPSRFPHFSIQFLCQFLLSSPLMIGSAICGEKSIVVDIKLTRSVVKFHWLPVSFR